MGQAFVNQILIKTNLYTLLYLKNIYRSKILPNGCDLNLVKKFHCLVLVSVAILSFAFLSALVSAAETTHGLSALMKKEVELGDDLKFDMFLHSSVTLVIPEKIEAGENLTWLFGLNPATIMIFLEIPSINKTYVTETEIPLEDLKPITVFDGVTLVLDLSPSAKLSVTGPATLNRTNISWENFLSKQSFETQVFLNASSKDELTINYDFYLDAQINVYIQLQNYSSEIVGYPIPQLEMLPKISHSVEIESTPTIIDALRNPINLLAGALAIALVVIAFLIFRKRRSEKAKKQTPIITPKQHEQPDKKSEKSESTIYCIYCGEQLPTEAAYCRRCGKKIS